MLKEKLKNHRIILASGSPRRHQFLKDLKIPFIIDVKKRVITRIEPHGEGKTFYPQEYLNCVIKGVLVNPINKVLNSHEGSVSSMFRTVG